VLFAQKSRAQVRGHNGRDDDVARLLLKSVPGCFAILVPERKGLADSGVSLVTRTRGQCHQTKGWILVGRNEFRFGSKSPNLGEKIAPTW
jgi:hypothetical protein